MENLNRKPWFLPLKKRGFLWMLPSTNDTMNLRHKTAKLWPLLRPFSAKGRWVHAGFRFPALVAEPGAGWGRTHPGDIDEMIQLFPEHRKTEKHQKITSPEWIRIVFQKRIGWKQGGEAINSDVREEKLINVFRRKHVTRVSSTTFWRNWV